ncbi:hypothetical protein BCEN4_40015 [Burkholderia cenocepacia]|nr:hypothetical protein BCEN4_40015 [Burkholderia cenocepacia]
MACEKLKLFNGLRVEISYEKLSRLKAENSGMALSSRPGGHAAKKSKFHRRADCIPLIKRVRVDNPIIDTRLRSGRGRSAPA